MLNTDNKFFDELARAATGAVGALSGIRQQIQTEIKSQFSKFIVEMDFVPRDEFDIVEAMAREARLQNQRLEARVIDLEKRLGLRKANAKAAAPRKATSRKTAKSAKPANKAKKNAR